MIRLKFLACALIVAVFSLNAWATESCIGAFTGSSRGTISFPKLSESIGPRGFLSAEPPASSTAIEAAQKLGIMHWGLRIYPVASLEQAMVHHQRDLDPVMNHMYVLTDQPISSLQNLVGKPPQAVMDNFDKIPGNGVFYLKGDQWIRLSNLQIAQLTQLTMTQENPEDGPYFYQRGWCAPLLRGVVTFERLQNSQTVKGIRKFARKLYAQGFRVTFNQDLPGVMSGASNQARKDVEAGSTARFPSDVILEYQKMLEQGRAYSVELWNPNHVLVAGIFGTIAGGVVNGDSVYYNQNFGNIDLAKVTAIALTDRLAAAGLKAMDAGMVTAFTRNTLKGEYVPRDEFMKLIQSAPSDLKFDWTTPWTP